jgi:hypothetical protein
MAIPYWFGDNAFAQILKTEEATYSNRVTII